jgi:hypothetical protein
MLSNLGLGRPLRLAISSLAIAGAALLAPASASANSYSIFHLDYPAASCYQNGSLGIWNGQLANSTNSTQYVECPIVTDDTNWYRYVSAFSTGTTNGVTCWIGVHQRWASGWAIFPNSRSYPSGYESQNWGTVSINNQSNVDLECSMAPGTAFTGYTVSQTWTAWDP